MCRLLGVSKQAYYKHEDHLMKRLALESFVVEFVNDVRRKDPGIGGNKLWLMYKQCFGEEETLHDFGHVPVANPRRQYDFTFTNTGRVPAVILNATPSCHCTFVEFSKEVVMPGKQGTVTVIFDGNEQPAGHFNKSVRARFNSEHLHNLRIKGVMEGE
ncbi:MAG: DUF1573 domain-containing protein [Bacteroidaceae bacterium]|nr:DUF1573 domain-containing protein [Bacteroidaceae bacterium]